VDAVLSLTQRYAELLRKADQNDSAPVGPSSTLALNSNRDAAKGVPYEMLAVLQENIAGGAVLIVPVDWQEVHSIAEQLSSRFTVSGGHRLLDILHLSTAVHLKARKLLTFDENQINLTKSAGLEVGP
jgi:predicted nucleic acid-binding protein